MSSSALDSIHMMVSIEFNVSKVKVQGREWPVGKLPFQINWELLHVKSEYRMGMGIDGHWDDGHCL